MNLQTPVEPLSSHNPNEFFNQDINEILRGEISATEAYDQVYENFQNSDNAHKLVAMKTEHDKAIQYWTTEAIDEGKIPELESSIWGAMVEVFVGASKIIGDNTALAALKRGEEHGLENYKKMLSFSSLSDLQKRKIKNIFIPRQKKHIDLLDSMIGMR
jgi:hypothetical protein